MTVELALQSPSTLSLRHERDGGTFTYHKICTLENSLPNTIDEATPMKPKKAAEEGHVSRLRVLIFAEGWSCLAWLGTQRGA